MASRLIILGATGDLAGRYLFPALADLEHQGVPQLRDTAIVGVGQEDWDTEAFRRHVADRLDKHGSKLPEEARRSLVAGLEYHQAEVTDPKSLGPVIEGGDGPVVLYLALPPGLLADVFRGLAQIKLPEGSRVIVEKPFGTDLASAKALNELILPSFPEHCVFRIDHFLGKQTIQNVLGLRFANRIFENLWNRDNIERVEITWEECVALEGRAGYYDRSGALRDMVQNHLLQLLCLVAMEPPLSFNQRDFRDRKVEVLRAVQKFGPDDVARHTTRGRYTAGEIDGRAIPNYVDEEGVDPARDTETFVQATLFIDNWRWSGVPFVLRSGKAFAEKRDEIVIHFKPVPHLPFQKGETAPNVLRLTMAPDQVGLGINVNGPGDPFDLERVDLNTTLAPQESSAYARLILDILSGDPILTIRGDEAEESWRIVEPILAAWKDGKVPMSDYPAGSRGPA
ncbi:glucose-6-phosphate dehydrogenase [Tundrisphaera sp. TA3]|uniref:glucose-6-phosphate dehydrogenase n=1 Tax=Tundrisphaera sp. TA3 TaxID=3435775 RepID=UPI003EBF049C